MGFLDRWRARRGGASLEPQEDIRAFLDVMQPISAPAEDPPPQVIAELSAACSAFPELNAVYLFGSDFGGVGESLLTVGLVLDEPGEHDPELFVTICEGLEPRLEPLGERGDAYIFQLLDEYSLDRVPRNVTPIFQRRGSRA